VELLMRRFALAFVLVAALPAAGAAQSAAEHVLLGDSAYAALHPADALVHFQAALAEDSAYETLWKATRAIADVAKQIEGKDKAIEHRRDSMYALGRAYAEVAVRKNPEGADGHFVLAMVIGRQSRTKGSKERVKFAKVIFDEATKAVQLDSMHDGALHVLGAWHAEVKRLSGVQRFFAKTLFGGGFMSAASWDKAVEYLERSVAAKPNHVYHRLELAEVYVDLDRYSKARELLQTIPPLPIGDVQDTRYKQEAAALLERIRDKKDKA
jgi:tetratricopeptide (TPR) repeat protein